MTTKNGTQSDPQLRLPLADLRPSVETREQRLERILGGMAGKRVTATARYWSDAEHQRLTLLHREAQAMETSRGAKQ